MHKRLIQLAALFLALAAPLQPAVAAGKTDVKKFPVRRGAAVRPLAAAKYGHAPYVDGDCALCHQWSDPARPGPLRKANIVEGCLECHEEMRDVMARKLKHTPVTEACTDCHNPHNSNEPGLLHLDQATLCTKCHGSIRAQLATAKVKHGAMGGEDACTSCHDPHAAQLDGLLVKSAYNLCMGCHSKDGQATADGTPMTNFKTWLAKAQVWHEPVKNRDCAACHRVHGSERFRLLTGAYPEKFNAAWDPKAYSLCFTCHDEKLVTEAATANATLFRNGKKNLHTVHVARQRGLSCRACHEPHAAEREHEIRETVPYGGQDWVLKIGFTQSPTGGSCAKSCHDAQTYDNTSAKL